MGAVTLRLSLHPCGSDSEECRIIIAPHKKQKLREAIAKSIRFSTISTTRDKKKQIRGI